MANGVVLGLLAILFVRSCLQGQDIDRLKQEASDAQSTADVAKQEAARAYSRAEEAYWNNR
jgi:outer membrane murein-binding lipoprotein Lpp